MANLSKERRDRMIAKLEELKVAHSDDASIAALNEIENALREKKYGLVWEEHSEAVDEMLKDNIPVLTADTERRLCKDENLPWNFIIEGDNLQALYLLEKTHHGKVDCIYIDPPYNTGARDWKYNNDYVVKDDDYRHSKWLSMMKSRLTLAKKLLNPADSVLIVTIDEKEYLHLGCLLEELFPEATIQMVSSVINHASVATFNSFNRNNEYIFFVMIGQYELQSIDYSKTAAEGSEIAWNTLRRHSPSNLRSTRPRQFYPIYINIETHKIVKIGNPIPQNIDRHSVEQIDGCVAVFPVRENGTEMLWGVTPAELKRRLSGGYVRVGKYEPEKPQQFGLQVVPSGPINDVESGKLTIDGYREDGSVIIYYKEAKKVLPKSQWDYESHDAKSYGSSLLKSIFADARFSYPKSIYAVEDAIRLAVVHKRSSLIVDFFAGSGTTMHAVNLLNAEDGGHRRCIMVTNNEVSEAEQKDFESRGIHKGDKEWEERGISKYVTWPRTVCAINGVDVKGEPLKGNYIGSDIPMSDGFKANVKYFKCDWTPRKPEEYLLSNALCLHIKELIELQTAQEVDNVKNVLLLTKDDYVKTVGNPEVFPHIENVWVNQNIMFNASELRMLKKLNFKYIPKEFFSQELREVGEYV